MRRLFPFLVISLLLMSALPVLVLHAAADVTTASESVTAGATTSSTEPSKRADPTTASEIPAVFGRDLFRGSSTMFEPNPDTPVPAEYLLGAGDSLSVVCWYGSTEYENTTITISPNGDAYLKLLGTLKLADKTLLQVQDELRGKYARFYKKMDLTVKLVGRRTIPVFIVGEVTKPGKYFLSSLSTVFTALYAAGGPTDVGSLRSIRLMRGQQNVGTIDVYDYLLKGKITDLPLKSGDTVFVPLAKKVVSVMGEVQRPARYELLDAESLGEVVALAGGTTSSSAERVSLARVNEQHQRQVLDLSLPADAHFAMRDGDIVKIGAVLPFARNAVTIEGAVNRPGAYPIEEAPTIVDLLKAAEGLSPDAYLTQAQLFRYSLDGKSQMVGINLERAMAFDIKENVTLRPLDRLVVHARNEVADLQIKVDGEVVSPGTFAFYEGMRISDALLLSGGVKPNATLEKALLVRINPHDYTEDVTEISLRGVLAHDAQQDLPLRNGDKLVVFPQSQLGEEQMVSIEGAVTAPGHYAYMGNMRVSHLLLLAKGVLQQAYTDRANLYRTLPDNSIQVIPVNLAQAISGVSDDSNPVLRPRDRLVVALQDEKETTATIKVDGYVRIPGEFRLTQGMRLSDALYLAGGMKADAKSEVALYRKDDDQMRSTNYPVNLVDGRVTIANDPILRSDDLISVRQDPEYARTVETVSVEGEVAAPGVYPAFAGSRQRPTTLYQLLAQSGALLPEAYAPGAVLYRKQSALYTTGQQWELIKTLRNLDAVSGVKHDQSAIQPEVPAVPTNNPDQPVGSVVPVTSNNATVAGQPTVTPAGAAESVNTDSLTNSLAKVISSGKDTSVVLVIPPRSMQDQQFSVSLPIDMERVMRTKGQQGDITLEPGDIIYVPKRPVTVTVLGGVVNSGSVPFRSTESLRHYIDAMGGFSPDGDQKRIVVMHVNGQIVSAKQVKTVQPGDIIIVPTKTIVQTIHTNGAFERILGSISQLALSVLPFLKVP